MPSTHIGLLMMHQGWTDIMNCLSLINWYSKQYSLLIVLMREDANELINFYVRNLENVQIFYTEVDTHPDTVLNYIVQATGSQEDQINRCYIGMWDSLRNDKYMQAWAMQGDFVRSFYEAYEIPYITRTNMFEIQRDIEAEKRALESIGVNDYILYHNYSDLITEEISELQTSSPNLHFINLHETTATFFDYIGIMEGAKEMHLVDSIWAVLAYLIDARYGLFSKIPITVYCKRGYSFMFENPVKLNNWKIVQQNTTNSDEEN